MRILFYQKRTERDELISAGVHIVEILNHLSRLGHIIIFPDGSQYSIMNPSPIEVDLQTTHLKSHFKRIKEYTSTFYFRGETLVASLFLKEIESFLLTFVNILRNKPDLIYRRHYVFNSEWILSLIFKIPCVVEVNAIVIDEIKTSLGGNKPPLWTIATFEKFSFKKATKYIVVTTKLKEVLCSDYRVPDDKIVVIENGANTDLFKPMEQSIAKRELNLDMNNRYICFVGAFAPWQGLAYFISAMPYVLKEYPEARTLIVGDGDMKHMLKGQSQQLGISDKVDFVGRVPYEKVPLYINACEICVAPFSKERNQRIGLSPLKLCEYLACGKPVVSSRISGLEVLENYGCGYLVEPEAPEVLAQAIIKLLHDPALAKRMGENGREYVLENRSWESVAKKVAVVCEDAVTGGKTLKE